METTTNTGGGGGGGSVIGIVGVRHDAHFDWNWKPHYHCVDAPEPPPVAEAVVDESDRRGMGRSTHHKNELAKHEASVRRRHALVSLVSFVLGALAAAFMLSGCCGCEQIRQPAAAIAEDLEVYDELVEPKATLSPDEKVKVVVLGKRLRANTKTLAEASK